MAMASASASAASHMARAFSAAPCGPISLTAASKACGVWYKIVRAMIVFTPTLLTASTIVGPATAFATRLILGLMPEP